jgi:hypothetical protein
MIWSRACPAEPVFQDVGFTINDIKREDAGRDLYSLRHIRTQKASWTNRGILKTLLPELLEADTILRDKAQ